MLCVYYAWPAAGFPKQNCKVHLGAFLQRNQKGHQQQLQELLLSHFYTNSTIFAALRQDWKANEDYVQISTLHYAPTVDTK